MNRCNFRKFKEVPRTGIDTRPQPGEQNWHGHIQTHKLPFSGRITDFLSPEYVLQHYSEQLTSFERKEIMNYKQVYYWGQNGIKQGTDEVRDGDFPTHGHAHVAYRYEIIQQINSGAFGVVMRAIDHRHGSVVALKVINEGAVLYKQGLLEFFINHQFDETDCEYICKSYDCITFRGRLVISFELLDINLYELLEANGFQGVEPQTILQFAVQGLRALAAVHKRGIVHCDIKPENFIFDSQRTVIKMADFGSGCYDGENIYDYVQSRFYRAPEVILRLPFGRPVDVWSMGCVLAELYSGRPLFNGEDSAQVLHEIQRHLGAVPDCMMMRSRIAGELQPYRGQAIGLSEAIPTNTTLGHQLQQLVLQMLRYDPTERPAAIELLNIIEHQYGWKCGGEIRRGATVAAQIVQEQCKHPEKEVDIIINMEKEQIMVYTQGGEQQHSRLNQQPSSEGTIICP